MSHHHHHHSHEHGNDEKTLSFDDKLVKLLQHWIQHNHDHVKNYRDWAKKAGENDLKEVIRHLEDAAEKTHAISACFEKALKVIALKKTV